MITLQPLPLCSISYCIFLEASWNILLRVPFAPSRKGDIPTIKKKHFVAYNVSFVKSSNRVKLHELCAFCFKISTTLGGSHVSVYILSRFCLTISKVCIWKPMTAWCKLLRGFETFQTMCVPPAKRVDEGMIKQVIRGIQGVRKIAIASYGYSSSGSRSMRCVKTKIPDHCCNNWSKCSPSKGSEE